VEIGSARRLQGVVGQVGLVGVWDARCGVSVAVTQCRAGDDAPSGADGDRSEGQEPIRIIQTQQCTLGTTSRLSQVAHVGAEGKYARLEVRAVAFGSSACLPGSPRVVFPLEATGSDSVSVSELSERMRS